MARRATDVGACKATVPLNWTYLTRARLILALMVLLVLLALPVVSPHSPLDIAARLWVLKLNGCFAFTEVCKMDFFRFCAFRVPDMKNMEDIVKCMDSHLDDLCPPCKEMVQNATSSLLGFHAACDASLTAQVCLGSSERVVMRSKGCARLG